MRVSVNGLSRLCQVNAVEIKFNRRRLKTGSAPSRRMLCTLDRSLLQSRLGKEVLHFRPPTQSPHYNASTHGLLVVWDILMQDWRSVPVDACEVVATVPTRPPEKFWDYFFKRIIRLTAAQKAEFFNK